MAKQTFTVGQVLTAAQLTSLQQTAMGGGAASAKTASYTLVAADAGTTISMTSTSATTITVNTGLFAAGDTVFIQNLGSGNCTVTAGTATVSTAGSTILPTNDAGILYFVSTGVAIFYDFIQTGAVSPLTTKGDLYGFSTLDSRIPIGANNTVLTADSNETLGLKWAAPAGGGGMTSLASGSLPAATSITLSSISADYKDLRLVIRNAQHGDGNGTGLGYRLNGQGDGTEYVARLNINSEYGVSAGSGSSRIPLTSNDAKKEQNITIQINIFDYANTSTNKRWQHAISYMKQGTTTWETNFQSGQYVHNDAAINQIQLFIDNAFTSGTYELLGIK